MQASQALQEIKKTMRSMPIGTMHARAAGGLVAGEVRFLDASALKPHL
jgi:hypothetical protein